MSIDIGPPTRPDADRITGDIMGVRFGRLLDLVVAFQVFEHLPRPRPILERLLQITRPGGIVVVHTDMEPPARIEPFAAWDYVCPPHHCSFFRNWTFGRTIDGSAHKIEWEGPWCLMIRAGAGAHC